ncbi:MAG TPA: glycerol-3-phosphate 1-O-acyltransferase [Solirubrobacteraceae bacterium]|jgi:glycerol-3-phosphate O-acyltransferase|nr:glycerol-3-phosphate 1-O-acyltransferase [Solirubrobacteraceae bacterium]
MSDQQVANGLNGDRPLPTGPGEVVVIIRARTATERALIERWAQAQELRGALVDIDDPHLAGHLEPGDPLVVPVRVAWLPRERGDTKSLRNRLRVTDLVVLAEPRRPWEPLQRQIATREPARARVIVGEPAQASELRDHFRRRVARGDAAALSAFVGRQATLACDRAERTLIGDRYKVPKLVAEQITASPRFRAEVQDAARTLRRPFAGVLVDTEICLRELATVQSPVVAELFRRLLSPMHNKAWAVEVDVPSLERLRALNRECGLVFLPCHRSYVDPLVLGEVLHRHDFPRNHLLGGDNMSFFPVGPLGRRSGVIFIRRNFGDDLLYKLAVREFLGHIVSKRFNLEWYIEGGRSRTGKLRPPRYGLLHYLVHAIEAGRAQDVQLVPVSISYEHQQEVRAITAEQGGATKRRESFVWFLDYLRAQREEAGAARVIFGEPFSLRGALAQSGDGPARLEKVAFAVCEGINRATPVTASSLVTYALLGARDRALTLAQVQRVIEPLLDYGTRRAIAGPIAALRRPARVRGALDALVEAGVASCFIGGEEPVWSIAPGGHHCAAFYRNGAIHWFVMRSIAELALLRLGSAPLDEAALERAYEDAMAVRDLLKFEFFFASKTRFQTELREEIAILAPGGYEDHAADAILADAPTLLAHRALRSFVDAQLVVAMRLAGRDPRTAFDREGFINECLGYGGQLLRQGRIHSTDSVSRELYGGAVKLAANRDLIDPGREPLRQARAAYLDEVREVSDRLALISELDSAKLSEVLDALAV